MKFETDRLIATVHDNLAHVRFKGPEVAEYGEASFLGQELRRVVGALEFQTVILDLEVFRFVTSTVLEAFVSMYLRCKTLGRQVKIANVNPLVREALRTTRLDALMPIFETLDEALASR